MLCIQGSDNLMTNEIHHCEYICPPYVSDVYDKVLLILPPKFMLP
jgi:hypothetical protein